jgi:hypothetical protein
MYKQITKDEAVKLFSKDLNTTVTLIPSWITEQRSIWSKGRTFRPASYPVKNMDDVIYHFNKNIEEYGKEGVYGPSYRPTSVTPDDNISFYIEEKN